MSENIRKNLLESELVARGTAELEEDVRKALAMEAGLSPEEVDALFESGIPFGTTAHTVCDPEESKPTKDEITD